MNDDLNLILNSFEKACEQLQLEAEVLNSIVDLSKIPEVPSNEERNSIKNKCLLLIQLYKKLYALSGNDPEFINHLLTTTNTELNGKPIELLKTSDGLERLVSYYSSVSKS